MGGQPVEKVGEAYSAIRVLSNSTKIRISGCPQPAATGDMAVLLETTSAKRFRRGLNLGYAQRRGLERGFRSGS